MESRLWSRLLGTVGLASLVASCGNAPQDANTGAPADGQGSVTEGQGTEPGIVPGSGNGPGSDSTGATSSGSSTLVPEDNGPQEPGQPACLAPKIQCGDACINPNTDPKHCGASMGCNPPHQGIVCAPGLVCTQGQCQSSCAAGELLCNGQCVNPDTNKDHCGASLDCQGANAGAVCTGNQVCDAGQCTQDCGSDQVACNGECIDPQQDLRFCGASLDCQGVNAGTACGMGQVCAGGICKAECDPGSIKCDGECVDPRTDNRFCGAKNTCMGPDDRGEVCPADAICSGGECELVCDAGLVECEGRCINPKTDNNFCGAKDSCLDAVKCASGQSCVDGSCQTQCPAGKIACNDQCIDPQTDNNFCGASLDCKADNAGQICTGDAQCVAGSCEVSCDADEIECKGSCINPKSDESFCGASLDCQGANAGQACQAGTHECIDGACKPQCESGKIACGDTCIDPNTNADYCGAQDPCDEVHNGEVCSDKERCIAGVCTFYCTFPEINCGGTCIDPRSSLSNCGAVGDCAGPNAGNVCDAGQACVDGACELRCAAGEIACDGRCVNPLSDRDYCGANAACNGGQSCGDDFLCSNGSCQRDCPADQVNCKDRCIDPLKDNTYCGAAGDCQDDNSGQTCAPLLDQHCVNGACELVCPAGEVACNGTCIDPRTSQNYCGATLDCLGANAGKRCPAPEQSCVAGVCENTGCGESEAKARPDPVVIELVLDKSGSMAKTWNSGGTTETRWKSLHRAVLDIVHRYGPQPSGQRGQASFGALLFPARDANLPFEDNQSRMCAAPNSGACVATTDAWNSSDPWQRCRQADGNSRNCVRGPYEVNSGLSPQWAPSANHNSAHFNGLLPHADSKSSDTLRWNRANFNDGNEGNRRRYFGGGTPTAQAMRSAMTVLSQPRYQDQNRVSILISDGATTGTSYSRSGNSCNQARANALESELFSVLRDAKNTQNIPTYVIGVDLRESATGGGPGGNCTQHTVNPRREANEMAKAGGTESALNVTDSAALQDAFDRILKDVLSCTIDIGTRPPYLNDVSVFFPDAADSSKKGPRVPNHWDKPSCSAIPGGGAGWVYANSDKTKIELCNGACTDFKDRLTGEIFVVKGCKGPE